jgi:hypothetical protein
MIDNFTILVSTIVIIYILLQAIRLNRTMPWFPRVSPPPPGQKRTPSFPAGPSRGRERRAGE